jgi:hypothetical protein
MPHGGDEAHLGGQKGELRRKSHSGFKEATLTGDRHQDIEYHWRAQIHTREYPQGFLIEHQMSASGLCQQSCQRSERGRKTNPIIITSHS